MPHGGYAELHALSNFTFLRGASHPEELVETAAMLGYEALAITDECSMSGIVRAHMAAKAVGLKLIVGSELHLRSGRKLVVLARNRNGYAALCRLITAARRAAKKGSYELTRLFFEGGLPDCIVLWVPDDALAQGNAAALGSDVARFLGKVPLQRAIALLDGDTPETVVEEDLLQRMALPGGAT